MLEELEFIPVDGRANGEEIILLGSSSCEFFSAATELLKERNLGYSYSLLDRIHPEKKKKIVRYLMENYTKDLLCPFLLLGKDNFISGFNREVWEQKLDTVSHE